MDKLSELINEARPLYKQRKRRNKVFCLVFAITLPVFVFGNILQLYYLGDSVYMSIENNKLQKELLTDDFGIIGYNN